MASWLNTFYLHSTSKFLYRFWFRIKSYWNALSEFLYMVSQKYVCLFDWFSYDKRTFFFGNMGQFDNSIFYSLKFCVYNICEEFNWPLIRGPKGNFGPVGTYLFFWKMPFSYFDGQSLMSWEYLQLLLVPIINPLAICNIEAIVHWVSTNIIR